MQNLVDEFLAPESSPDQPYEPSKDVVSISIAANFPIVFEVFLRSNQNYGFRYSAWVAWRDAGGNVRSQSWWQAEPQVSIVGSVPEAQKSASEFAAAHGIKVGGLWEPPANKSFNGDAVPAHH